MFFLVGWDFFENRKGQPGKLLPLPLSTLYPFDFSLKHFFHSLQLTSLLTPFHLACDPLS